ncbi:MAG: NnrS family protein [Pseudomonadota bacterium]|nr:NnrS family protein [Pseudomonadota bacterium]
MTPSPESAERRAQRFQSAVLALGFRPFFLLAGLGATALMVPWLVAYSGGGLPDNYYGPYEWHPHEMLFGYAMAVVAGFLLTAVRNWTSLPTPVGGSLAALAILWLAGRVIPFLDPAFPGAVIAIVDCAFIPALAYAIGRPLIEARQHRNLFVLALLAVLLIANLMVHLERQGFLEIGYGRANILALETIVMLMVVMGGRVIPFFTTGALGGEVRRVAWIERTAVPLVGVMAAVDLFWPGSLAVGAVAGVAAVIHALRLASWYQPGTHRAPLLWVLHLGYAWVVLGLVLRSLAAFDLAPLMLAWHAFAAGGIGVLTLGMMSRVALGHTGRALRVGGAMTAAFVLVNLAAVMRVLIPLILPDTQRGLIVASGLLWIAAFLVFAAVYWPILTRPRVDGRPG